MDALTDGDLLERLTAHSSDPGIIRYARYWLACRAGRLIPLRCDFRPEHLRADMTSLVVIEPIDETRAPIRLAGSRLKAFFGKDLTGADYFGLARPEVRAIRVHRAMNLVRRPCGAWTSVRRPGARGDLFLDTLLLPWGFADGRLPHLIGRFVVPEDGLALDDVGADFVGRAFDYAFIDLGAGVPSDTMPAGP